MTGRRIITLLALAVFAAFAAYVRLAPSDLARWHAAPRATGDWGKVAASYGSASLRLAGGSDDARQMLARLDEIALATPRTQRLAGSVTEGRITWITRSRLWGFPDYTTAELRPDGLYIFARLRFGGGDQGVNAARLRDWLARL